MPGFSGQSAEKSPLFGASTAPRGALWRVALRRGYSEAMGSHDLVSAPDGERIDAFLHDLWLQRGLSEHTRNAYRSDLAAVQRWLGPDQSLPRIERSGLFAYLAARFEQGYKPRSTARLLSALRAFFAGRSSEGFGRMTPLGSWPARASAGPCPEACPRQRWRRCLPLPMSARC